MTSLKTVIDILREYGAALMLEREKNETADLGEFCDQAKSAASDASTTEVDAPGG